MSNNKKYYYLKLKENFFDTEEIKILEAQKNSEKYQLLYLKLCLLSIKNNGKLAYRNLMPYDLSMFSSILRIDIDTVRTGLELLERLGLIDILESGVIYMNDIQSLIGHSSTEAERIASYRKKVKDEKCTNVRNCYESCTPELELELKKETDKEIKIEIESIPHSAEKKIILETWNSIATDNFLPKAISITPQRLKKYNLRVKEGLDLTAIAEKIKMSPFLRGDNPQKWRITFDWLIENSENWLKVMEEKYRNKERTFEEIERDYNLKYGVKK